MDKFKTRDKNIHLKKEEEKANFAFQLERVLTFALGLIISSLIFGFFGIAIGVIVGGENGAEIGIIVGLILAAGFSFVMLSNKKIT